MKVYIELIMIIIIVALILIWFIWHKISGWIAKKNYKPENDKSRKGGENFDGRTTAREPEATTEPVSVVGNEHVERRELLPNATSDIPRPNISSSRKASGSSGIRKLLRRNKK